MPNSGPRASKRWPLIAAGAIFLAVLAVGFIWFGTGLVHAMNHVTIAQASPSPAPPEPAFTTAPVAEVSTPYPAPSQTAFPSRPVRAVASLFVPTTPKPAGCCVRASFQSSSAAQPGQVAQTQQASVPPSPPPVIVHKLETMDFGSATNAAQAAPMLPAPSIPPTYALPTATPNAQSRYVIPSEYEISDTDCFRVKLRTKVDSQVPGELIGEISRPIFDSAQHATELIPAGSTIHGNDDHASLVQGQAKLGLDWYEIVLPNSVTIPMGRQRSADLDGAGGVSGQVDTHSGRAFGQFVLYTLVNAVGNAIGRVSYLGGASIGSQFAGNAQDIKPTITIPQNTDLEVCPSGPITDLRPWSEVAKWHP